LRHGLWGRREHTSKSNLTLPKDSELLFIPDSKAFGHRFRRLLM
jgi:hypothetical protein